MSLQANIERIAELTGYDPSFDGDTPLPEYAEFSYGDRVEYVSEGGNGVFEEGEQGYVVLLQVGGVHPRATVNFLVDGSDCPEEVSPMDLAHADTPDAA